MLALRAEDALRPRQALGGLQPNVSARPPSSTCLRRFHSNQGVFGEEKWEKKPSHPARDRVEFLADKGQ